MTVPELIPPIGSEAAQRADRLKAIALMCVAVSLFAGLDAIAKYLVGPGELPVWQVVGMRFASNMVLYLALNIVLQGPRAARGMVRTRRPLLQLVRSLFQLAATVLNFVALIFLQLDQTITIFYAAPLMVAALAGPLLGEWVGWHRLLAILAGFGGVLLVTRPGFGGVHWAIMLSFGATLCLALYNIATRYLARHDPIEVTLFYTPLVGLAFSLPFMIADWVWPQDVWIWVLLLLVGVLASIGHWLLIFAHARAPAAILAPFIYTNLLTALVLGYAMFGDVPDVWTMAGAAVIIASGLYLFYREQVRKGPLGGGGAGR